MADQELFDLTYSQATILALLAGKADNDDVRTSEAQDAIDAAQDAATELKANSADVRTSATQDVIDAAQNEAIADKAPISMNMRSYFNESTGALYTTDNGNDPQP